MVVPKDVRESVAFVTMRTNAGYVLLGTAFFVSLESERFPPKAYSFLVTAKHVIVQAQQKGIDGKVHIRVNTRDGKSTMVAADVADWFYHPEDSSVDVAALIWPSAPEGYIGYRQVSLDLFATERLIEEESIGVGDEVFITGLFVNHAGRGRNLPIVRIGNIALMPEEKITTKFYGDIDAYLVESRSIGGLSGSPVFVHISKMIPRYVEGGGVSEPRNVFYLLGLMHGHWDLPIPEPGSDAIITDSLRREAINMGIAIVVPAIKIIEVIKQPEILKMIREYEAKLEEGQLSTLDSVSV